MSGPGPVASQQAMLAVSDVHKAFGGVRALSGCSFEVAGGAITGLIGANGSGKTTLFNVATGMVHPDRGEVHLDGSSLGRLRPDRRARIGLGRTFQQPRVFGQLRVLDNMAACLQTEGVALLRGSLASRHRREQMVEVLEFVGLADHQDRLASDLSYGQRKLLELAMAVAAAPKLLLLDEPVGGVTPAIVDRIADRIRVLNSRGMTFLIVEHNMGFVMGLCSKVVVMDHGRVMVEGSPDELGSDARVLDAFLGG